MSNDKCGQLAPRVADLGSTISALPGQTIVVGGLECPVPGKPDLQKELVIILTPQRVWWDGVESERPTLARELLTRIRQQLPQARLTL